MLLTISTTHSPATDLGFLLHKHPDRVLRTEVAWGTATVCFPEATADRCTVAVLLEVDPIALVRGRSGRPVEGFSLGQYVNDRPYAASSLLAVSMGKLFSTARSGRCDARPELAASAVPLEIHVPALPCAGGPDLARRLFEPLGWVVDAAAVPLDPTIPEWGRSRYVDLHLTGTLRLADALTHLYVLLPVLDGAKHYWVGAEEVDKLVRAGSGWLAGHPEKEAIARGYLARRGHLTRDALARLAEIDDDPSDLDATEAVVAPPTLADQRRATVLQELRSAGVRRVADLGCGEGRLVADLLADPAYVEIVATDVSVTALERTAARLRLDRLPDV